MILHFSLVCVLGFMSFSSLEFLLFGFSYVHVQVLVFFLLILVFILCLRSVLFSTVIH